MKKEQLVIVIGLSIFFALYFFNTQNYSLKNYPPRNRTIVAFGDSLIQGYGSTVGKDFVSLLSEKLKRPVINLGVIGNTTRDGLYRTDEVILKNPGTVIMLFGGNDYLVNIPKEETFNNIREVISRLQSKGIFVVLLGVQGGVLNDGFESSFIQLSKEMGVLYVPNVLSELLGDPNYMFDLVHPNDKGHAFIADRIYSVVRNYIW